MDGRRLGTLLRAARVRRRLRQVDLAAAAGVSDSTISRIERGQIDGTPVGTLAAVARVLDVSIDHRPWGRDLDRLVNAGHAELVEDVVGTLQRLGWTCRPEASFNHFGERGFVDLLAWHPGRRALLVIEAKTAIVDVGELLATFDRKRRVGPRIGRELGWDPEGPVSAALIIRAGRTNRRHVAAHSATLRASLPDSALALRAYLRDPAGPAVAAITFWPDSRGVKARPGLGPVRARRTAWPGGPGRSPRSR